MADAPPSIHRVEPAEVLRAINVHGKARACLNQSSHELGGANYTNALVRAADEAYRLLREAGIEMTEEHAVVLATRFVTEGALSGLPFPVEGDRLNEWLFCAERFLWQKRIQPDPAAPLLGYQLERMAVEAVASHQSLPEITGQADRLIADFESKMSTLLPTIPPQFHQPLRKWLQQSHGLAPEYFINFQDPFRFINYVLQMIELLAVELFETPAEIQIRLDDLKQEARKKLIPRFGPLLVFYADQFPLYFGRPTPEERSPENILDQYITYWSQPLPELGFA